MNHDQYDRARSILVATPAQQLTWGIWVSPITDCVCPMMILALHEHPGSRPLVLRGEAQAIIRDSFDLDAEAFTLRFDHNMRTKREEEGYWHANGIVLNGSNLPTKETVKETALEVLDQMARECGAL